MSDLVEKLRSDAKHGYGAAMDWTDEERADYWARMCIKARQNAAEAAEEIERLTLENNTKFVSKIFLYAQPQGLSLGEWRENVRKTKIYQNGDTVLVWVNEADLFSPQFERCEEGERP